MAKVHGLVVALAWLLAPAGRVPAPAAAQTASASDLEIIANFFLPGAPAVAMVRRTCDSGFRGRLATNPADQLVEQALPGVHERMIATAAAYCDRELPLLVARIHARIKADWSTMVSSADLARLARLVATATREALDMPVEVPPEGSDAADRDERDLEAMEARLVQAQIAFARTPGGPALLHKVAGYQRQLAEGEHALTTEFAKVVRAALREAYLAANALARDHGMPALYPDP